MKKLSRRKFVNVGLPVALWVANMRQSLASPAAMVDRPPMILSHLIRALKATGKPVCAAVADRLQALPEDSNGYNLHLRNAGLDNADVVMIAQAIATVDRESGPLLQSFSLSYNQNVRDEGVLTLVGTLPSNVKEIGLVECGIGDKGGNALVEWATRASKIHWLCVEGNSFSDETKSKLIALGRQRDGLLVVV